MLVQVKAMLNKNKVKRLPPIRNDFVLDPVYEVTKRGRPDFHIQQYVGEQWLVFQQQEPRIMMFQSPIERDITFHSHLLIGDGTFKTCPLGFQQVYNLYSELNGEPVKLCMPKRRPCRSVASTES